MTKILSRWNIRNCFYAPTKRKTKVTHVHAKHLPSSFFFYYFHDRLKKHRNIAKPVEYKGLINLDEKQQDKLDMGN